MTEEAQREPAAPQEGERAAPFDGAALLAELRAIREELEKLNGHRLLTAHETMSRYLLFMLLRGILGGFGTVVGATLVVSWFFFLLSQMEFIPIIGGWVREIISIVQNRPQ